MSTVPPPMPPAPGAPAKKTSPLVWILGIVAVIFCGIMLTCGVVGFMAYRAVKNAGFDAELMQKNPGLAMTKMAAALHPDLQVVSTDDRSGKITMREKSTGKIMTFRFDPDQKTLVMTGDDGKEVRMTASGDGANGSLTVRTADGTMRYGAGAGKAPAWVPVYPGSSPVGNFSAESGDGGNHSFTFKTSDAASKVIAYYQDQLKGSGFTFTQTATSDQGGMLAAESADKKRSLIVTVGSSNEGTEGSVVATEKK